MKLFSLTSILSLSAVTLATTLISSKPAYSQQATFVCGTSTEGFPATIVKTQNHGDVNIITWNSGFFESSGFDNQARCDLVSKKFQEFQNQGMLKYFTAGSANKQPVICAVPSMNSPCNSESQLFTLKPGSNPEQTLQKLFGIRRGASQQSLYENNNVNANDRTYLNFEEVLKSKVAEANGTTAQQPSSAKKSQEANSQNLIF